MSELLNSWMRVCVQPTCVSTYHAIVDGKCSWCGVTAADIIAAGSAFWIRAQKQPAKVTEGAKQP